MSTTSKDGAIRGRLTHPEQRRLFDYWLRLCKGRGMPSRGDVDPVEIPGVLPHLLLMDVVHGEPMRFRLRLQGTALVERYGEHTGRYMDEIGLGDAYEDVAYSYKTCARTGQPQFSETDYWTDMRRYFHVSRLVLPLSEDDRTVNMVLAGLFFRTGAEDDRRLGL